MTNYEVIETSDRLEWLTRYLVGCNIFAFDTETTGLDWVRNNAFLLIFCDGVNTWLVPVNRFAPKMLEMFLFAVFRDPNKWVIGQNLKFDAHFVMKGWGVEIRRQWHDTQLMAYLMDENRQNGLKKLMPALLNMDPADETMIQEWMKLNLGKKENWDYSKVPEQFMFPYAATDGIATFKLYEHLQADIERHFSELYNTDRQVLKILWKMEQNGVKVDRTKLEDFKAPYELHETELTQQMHQLAGYEFNPDSPDQLVELFYTKLGFPVKFFTKSKDKTKPSTTPSTDNDALAHIDHPLAGLMMQYRDNGNPLTQARTYLKAQDDQGYVHGNYNMVFTKTGRFSCSEPNLQNVRKEAALRACFVADEGWDMFHFDHAQIEMVGFAHYSRDVKMMEALHRGDDLHKLAASEALGVPIEQITKEQRAVGKGTNFSIIYGVGKAKLANYINGYMPADGAKLTDAEAQTFKNKYFAKFPSVRRFQDEVKFAIIRKREPWGHFVKNQFGRVRRINNPVDIRDADGKVTTKGMAWTGVNHLIQGWAPDAMKKAMVAIEQELHPRWRQNIHDANRIDAPADQTPEQRREWVATILKHMTTYPEVRVPIKCSAEWSNTNWAELKDYK